MLAISASEEFVISGNAKTKSGIASSSAAFLFAVAFVVRHVDFRQELENAVPALRHVVELEVKQRGKFQDHTLGEFALEVGPQAVQLRHVVMLIGGLADDADEDVRVLEIRRDIDLLDGDELRVESAMPHDQLANFPFKHFVNARETMFHRAGKGDGSEMGNS